MFTIYFCVFHSQGAFKGVAALWRGAKYPLDSHDFVCLEESWQNPSWNLNHIKAQ